MLKKLPSHPNLSYLKNQARQLKDSVNSGNIAMSARVAEHLSHYRQGESLTLSDTQFIIAREYGFSSWAKLKHAVEQGYRENNLLENGNDPETLHITCGDSQSITLKQCGIPGLRLPWRDLLNLGPLPATDDMESFCLIRAQFIANWVRQPGMVPGKMARDDIRNLYEILESERVILWFWPLLTHQLTQLLILNWLSDNDFTGEILLIDSSRFPGQYDSEAMLALYKDLKPVSTEQVAEAKLAWTAVRQPTPENLLEFVKTSSGHLPHLRNAMLRFLEELPSCYNGLSRTQQAILMALKSGHRTPDEIYGYVYNQEEFCFTGDRGLLHLIAELIETENPLIRTGNGAKFDYPPASEFDPTPHLELTTDGVAVCDGNRNYLDLEATVRWWAGVHLTRDKAWCFDKTGMNVNRRLLE